MRSSVLTTSIVPFGRKPGELATRNHVQPPELLDKIDERQGGFQFSHCVQKCGGVFCCSLCAFVWWLHRANEAADCHDSASSSLESSLNSKKHHRVVCDYMRKLVGLRLGRACKEDVGHGCWPRCRVGGRRSTLWRRNTSCLPSASTTSSSPASHSLTEQVDLCRRCHSNICFSSTRSFQSEFTFVQRTDQTNNVQCVARIANTLDVVDDTMVTLHGHHRVVPQGAMCRASRRKVY